MLKQGMGKPEKSRNWGGKRANATGRPTLEGERQRPHMVYMTALRWACVLRIGGGNYSQGVRKLLDFYKRKGRDA